VGRLAAIRPEFVEFVPKELEEGVLYISIAYGATVHKCACGCRSKVTLPLNPAKWRLMFDGETVSLWPSVGNWSYPCQSHYWIEQNSIEWASKWSAEKIEENRIRDRAARELYLKSRTEPVAARPSGDGPRRGLIDRIRGVFRR
jgi:Family of unknown function (DUF6527)